MAYLAPIHQPSSIRHALKLNFLAPDEDSLVVAKSNRLEIFAQTHDGLVLRHSKSLYGKITMLNKLRPASSTTDHLFIGLDNFVYFTVSWDPSSKQLKTEKSYEDIAEKSARDSQTGDRCHIDPSGGFLTLELYEGMITVVPIAKKQKKSSDPEVGTLGEPIQIRISEMFVRSSTFFKSRAPEKDEKPKLALLYEDAEKKVRLKTRRLVYSPGLGSGDPGSAELEEIQGMHDELELGASHLIPVPEPACGVLIIAETSITYFEHSFGERPLRKPLDAATIFVAWEQIDRQRFVLADEYGMLYLLMLELDQSDHVTGWKIDRLGYTSRASVLTYLDGGAVFVGSHQGDSQIVRIKPGSVEILQTFPNIAPILDFTVMDMGNRAAEGQGNEYSSGQARLITGSGAFKDGSLRSVRSGVGLEDLGLLDEMENITQLFGIRSNSSTQFDDTLLISFIDETRLFKFSPDGDVEELGELNGLAIGESTLFAANVQSNRILQVTSGRVMLLDLESGMVVSEWTPPKDQSITAVTSNDQVAVVSAGGVALTALDISNDLSERAKRSFDADSQVACLNISPSGAQFCIVGFWQGSSVAILSLQDLSTISTEQIVEEGISVPRSLLLVNVLEDQDPILFIAMADGSVITYSFDPSEALLSGKKSIVLGTQQANFRALPRGSGLYNVFATCEHPSLIYGSEGRIVYSAVTAEKASTVCPFNAQAFPDAIAIATPHDLKLAQVDEERSTHVRPMHVGETVRRIAYSAELKLFGLGTIKRELTDGVEVVQSHFKLADEVVFNEVATYALNDDELVESVMRGRLADGTGKLAERFVVGTAYLDDEHGDAVRGRILVFEVTEDRKLKLITEQAVKGACRCLAMVEDKLVAALIKTVVVYTFEYQTPSSPFLTKAASYRTATAPIDLAVEGNVIAIADLMKSVSIVEYHKSDTEGEPDKLNEVARHFQTTWGTAVAQVDENTFLESDAEGNLMVLNRDVKGVTFEDQRRLQVTSEMNLGEMVNRIRKINVPASANAIVIPRAFLATVEGSIHLFALIAPAYRDLLMRLQATMTNYVQSPGNVPFNRYRAFKSLVREEQEPFRFVDGELVERFLDCNKEVQEKIVGELGLGDEDGSGDKAEEVRSLIEGLRRLR